MTKALKENAAVFTAHEEDWLATIRFTMTNLYGQTQSCVFQTSAKHIHPNPHTSHGWLHLPLHWHMRREAATLVLEN